MKKSIAFFITALFICSFVQAYFLSTPALAFDPEYTVFEPPMIYSVYEEEGGVIPSEHVILRSESDEGSREAKHVIPSEQHVIPPEHVILSDSEGSIQVSSIFLNPFDILLSIGKIQDSAFKYKNAILELKEKLWQPPKDPSVVTLKYWNSLTEKQQKELHYYRNNYQGDLPYNILWVKSEFPLIGSWYSHGNALAHNLNGASGNIDYRGRWSNGHKQVIYDKDGIIVTDQENMGTYDFEKPSIFDLCRKHLLVDVKPWIEWGNSPDDTTTKNERIASMAGNFWGQRGLDYLGYKY